MYKVLCDDTLMCDSRIEELALINPVAKLEENKAGSFSFILPPGHPYYDSIKKRKSIISVYIDEDAEPVFSGQCIEVKKDFYNQKTIYCEGELAFLNDSIQRPKRYEGYKVRGLLEAYIANHNAQVDESKRFTVGQVTVKDSNDYISCYTNMESTMKAIKEDLVDDLGGIIRIRHEGGVRYIDYLAESPNTNSQAIRLGENLLDYTSNIDATDIATSIIPLGAKLEESTVEGLETRLTIESVNNGIDYVHNADAVAAYGWIHKTITFDDVTTPEALKRKGEQYLTETQFENVVIEAKVVDLHFADKAVERFKISDQCRVESTPHGMNKNFRLTKQTLNLNNPEKDKFTLGKNEKTTLSAKSNQVSEEIRKAVESIVPPNHILNQAVANATALITSAMGGYVVKTQNELLIMDTDDIETATKVWRWNINGLGYSSKGYKGPYALAMTMDGKIVADFIEGAVMEAGSVNSTNGTDRFSVKAGYAQFFRNEETYGGIGANTLETAGNTYKTSTFRGYVDLIVFSQDGKPYYVINPGNNPLTDNEYTENHYFDGSARFTGNVQVNDWLFGKNAQVDESVIAKGVQVSETITAKDATINDILNAKDVIVEKNVQATDIKATNDIRGQSIVVNKMGIGDGAIQDVEWVWNPQFERYCLCTIT